jgi:hypothetical protein
VVGDEAAAAVGVDGGCDLLRSVMLQQFAMLQKNSVCGGGALN